MKWFIKQWWFQNVQDVEPGVWGSALGKLGEKNWRFGGHRFHGIGCVWVINLSLIIDDLYRYLYLWWSPHFIQNIAQWFHFMEFNQDGDPRFWSFLFSHLFLEGIWSAIGNGQGQLRILRCLCHLLVMVKQTRKINCPTNVEFDLWSEKKAAKKQNLTINWTNNFWIGF